MDIGKPAFEERSKRYRRAYLGNLGALYGNVDPDIVVIKPKVKKKRKSIERQIQIQLVTWMRLKRLEFTAIPNEGRRSKVLGSLMKMMGLTPGVSDLFIAETTQKFAGFWLELKQPDGKLTELQQDWLNRMLRKGYYASWSNSFDDAVKQIEWYLTT